MGTRTEEPPNKSIDSPPRPRARATTLTAAPGSRVPNRGSRRGDESQTKLKKDKGATKESSDQKSTAYIPGSERGAVIAAMRLEQYIDKTKGQYARDEDGSLHVILQGQRIALDDRDPGYGLKELMIEVCGLSTVTPMARATIQRVQVKAHKKSSRIRLRKFSALSEDRTKLYIPVQSGKLLQITAEKISEVENGYNDESFWVEHPEDVPFRYSSGDPTPGLGHFEQLVVETQACRHPEMRWFVAMDEAFFPYIRDGFPARFLLVHIGPSQQGKTTGAQRFTLLHGLGEVKGDYTVAAFANMGDIGLLVMDNKEQANFSQPLIDFCLYLATGAQRGRSSKSGDVRRSGTRPVGVITTIEGVYKSELQNRCASVEYRLAGRELPRYEIENEIRQRRNEISSAMVSVLQRYLRNKSERRGQPNSTPNPIPAFKEHFAALCDLLRAYGQVTKRPAAWAERMIEALGRILGQREVEEDELEHPLLRVLEERSSVLFLGKGSVNGKCVTFQGRRGHLFVTECATLLTALQELNIHGLVLPKTPSGLGRRLRGRKHRSFEVLDEESAPELSMLKRQGNFRPIGFFIPDDGMTENDVDPVTSVIPQPCKTQGEPADYDSMTVETSKSK